MRFAILSIKYYYYYSTGPVYTAGHETGWADGLPVVKKNLTNT